MATMAPARIFVVGPGKCRVRDNLIFAFLLAVNRLNDDASRVELARNDEFREEASLALEKSRRECNRLQDQITMHCMGHRC